MNLISLLAGNGRLLKTQELRKLSQEAPGSYKTHKAPAKTT